MDLNPVIVAIPIYFLLIGTELIYTKLRRPDYYGYADTVANISCGIGDQVVGVFAQFLTLGVYQYVFQYHRLWELPQGWASFLLAFVLADLLYYWEHRLSHEINFLWAGHVVHHQSETYNLSVALRQSWFHKFFTFVFFLPLALIGIDTVTFMQAWGLNLLYQFFIHTETVGRLGPLEWVLNTPSHHRVHHGRNPKYIDKNHAGVFIIWDRLFGTFQVEEETPVYGITTPLKSFDPLWANVSHWVSMWQEARGLRWADALKLPFMPPGWRPAYAGGQHPIPQVSRESTPRFVLHTPGSLKAYIVVQFTLLLGYASFFLFAHTGLALWQNALFALGLVWSIVMLGRLFEQSPWLLRLEWIRLPLCLGVLFWPATASLPWLPWVSAGIVLLSAGAVGWLLSQKPSQKAAQVMEGSDA